MLAYALCITALWILWERTMEQRRGERCPVVWCRALWTVVVSLRCALSRVQMARGGTKVLGAVTVGCTVLLLVLRHEIGRRLFRGANCNRKHKSPNMNHSAHGGPSELPGPTKKT